RLVRGVDLRMMNEKSEKDRYGRTLAVLTLPDGRILNRVLVQSGHAFFYPHGRTLDELDRVLLDDQRTAMASHRGFWGRILLRPEASQSFVGSEQSRRFHTSDCPYGKRINWKNRISFSTLREAFGAGYAPCRSCTPWPGE
ncbi:MAG: thermonuclease family protein, partial [Deltaproteobacteria bacterium]|nr:thermonuclease family protein [Deltaproteobacteria bacterium]